MADAVRDLIIRLRMDTSQAQAESAAFFAEQAKRQAAAAASTATASRAQNAKLLTDAEVLEKAKTEIVKKENRSRVAEIARAYQTTADLVRAAAREQEEAAKKVAREQAEASRLAARAAKEQEIAARRTAKEQEDSMRKQLRDATAAIRERLREGAKLEKEVLASGRRMEAEQERLIKNISMLEHKRLEEARKSSTSWVKELTVSMVAMNIIPKILGPIEDGFRAMADSAREARDYVRGIVGEMEAARTAGRELAALRNRPATAAFTAVQAQRAAAAGVSPDEYSKGETVFQAYAGQYIGTGEGKKLGQEQADDLLRRVSTYSASQGIGIDESAKLMGTIVSKAKPGATNEELMTTFAKSFKAMQLAPGYTGPIIGQLSKLAQEEVGEGGTFDEVLGAAPLIRTMSERNPEESATYGRALIRGLRKIRADPAKAAAMGIRPGMSFIDQVKAVSSAARKHKGFEDEGQFLAANFRDIREFGAVRTALGAGVRGKGFERVQAEMAGVNAGTVAAESARYLAGEEGQAQTNRSMALAAQRETAARYVNLEQIKGLVRPGVLANLDKSEGLAGLLTKAGERFGMGSREEQEVRAETGRYLYQRLLGTKQGRDWLSERFGGTFYGEGRGRDNPWGRNASEDDLANAANALAKIRAELAKASAETRVNASPVPPALPGKPPPIQQRP